MAYTTRAVVHKNYKNPIEIKEYTISDNLKPTQLVIKTEFASINPIDVKLHSLTFRNNYFHTLKDFSGTVASAGSKARTKFPVGTKVFGSIPRPSDESYVGSYTIVDTEKDSIGKLPSKLTFEQGAAIGVAYGTAYQMLEKASAARKLDASSRVLILGGATSVGTFAIEIAKLFYGVKNVVATCSPKSAEYVKDYGADYTISYRVPNLSAEFVKFVKEHGGAKFDTIIDCVGGYDAIKVSNEILKPVSEGSTYFTVMGDAPPAKTYTKTMVNAIKSIPCVSFRMLFGKFYGINYSFLLLSRGVWTDAASEVFNIPNMRVPIDSVTPLADVKSAWNKLDSTQARGKLIINMQE